MLFVRSCWMQRLNVGPSPLEISVNEERTNLGRVSYVLNIQPRHDDAGRTRDCSEGIRIDQGFRCVLNTPGHRSNRRKNGVSWDTGVLGKQNRSIKGCWKNSSGHRTTHDGVRVIDRKTKDLLLDRGQVMYFLVGLGKVQEDDGLTVSAHSQIQKAAV
jgi:hypothetical protein